MDASNPSIGLSNTIAKIENGKFICSFKREKFIPGVKNYFDLNKGYFILFAKGGLSNGQILYHGADKVASDRLINFQTDSNIQTTTQPIVDNLVGEYSNKDFNLKWTNEQNEIAFDLSCDIDGTSDAYLSVGFSNDDKMVILRQNIIYLNIFYLIKSKF